TDIFKNRHDKACRKPSHFVLVLTINLCFVLSAFAQSPEFFRQFCTSCHNNRLRTGNLTLEAVDSTNPSAHAETLEKVVSKLRANAMPPQGMRQPSAAERSSFIASLENTLDRAAVAHPNAGRPAPHRLNRTEYANAIRDLLSFEISGSELPPDDSGFGFDNIA